MRKLWLKAVETIARQIGLNDPRLYRMFSGGTDTYAGENVSINSAMGLDTVWACVMLIAQTISTLPLQLYQYDKTGRGVVAREHPLYAILHDQPNADMTSVTFWMAMVGSLLLWGNAYAQIERTAAGRVIALTPLLPDRLTPQRQNDGSILYLYRDYGGKLLELTEDQIFHVKGFSLDGLVGLSPISQARESLGIALAAEKTAASLFRNSMRPGYALIAPNYMTKEQRARYEEELKPKLIGSINAGSPALLEGGWTIQNISMNPDDAQLLASRGFSVETVCRWFNVAPPMIGHMEKSTAWGTGLEQMNQWFLTYTLRSRLKAIEQEIRRSLLTAAERLLYYAEFNVDGLLRADSAGRAALMQTYAVNGLRTRNELRALENQGPLEGGDVLTVNMNMIHLTDIGKSMAAAAGAQSASGVNDNVAA
jgi:HK97 family phage portal protein